jgi:general stress protein 26
MTDTQKRKLIDLLDAFDVAMMVTFSSGQIPNARPMQIAEAAEDGSLYFATSLDSGKIRDIEADPRLMLIMQKDGAFVSLSGKAHLSTDRALIDRLWSKAWQVWFPKGQNDPNIVIVHVEPEDAEYWDSSGAKGVAFAVNALTAYIKGERPTETDAGQHGKVSI